MCATPVCGRRAAAIAGILILVAVIVFPALGASGIVEPATAIGAGDGTINGTVLTADGDPAADDGIIVFVEEGESVGQSEMVRTGTDGSFSVEPPGGQALSVGFYHDYPDGDPPFPNDGVPDVYALEAVEGPADIGTVTLPESHPVEVVVVDDSGDPIDGARVSVEHRNGGATAALAGVRTGASGRLDLPDDTSLELTGDVTVKARRPAGDDRFVDEVRTERQAVTDSTTITVTIRSPTPPTADTDAPGSAEAGDGIALDASGSTDPDDDWLAHEWEQVSGPDVVLSGTDAPTASFEAPDVDEPTELTFVVTVEDQYGLTDDDRVTVTVEPTSDSGGDAGESARSSDGTEDSPLRLEAAVDGNATAVTVLDGNAGESGTVVLSGHQKGPIVPEEVTVALADEVTSGTLTVAGTRDPPGRIDDGRNAIGYLTLSGDGVEGDDLDSLTFVLGVKPDALPEGSDVASVTALQYDGRWEPVNATAEDGAIAVTVDSPGTVALVAEDSAASAHAGTAAANATSTDAEAEANAPGMGLPTATAAILFATTLLTRRGAP